MRGKCLQWEKENRRMKGAYAMRSPLGHAKKSYDGFSTEKQVECAKSLVATCERCGIDLSFAHPRFGTKDDCNRVINTAITMLKKNGYDSYGNRLEGETT